MREIDGGREGGEGGWWAGMRRRVDLGGEWEQIEYRMKEYILLRFDTHPPPSVKDVWINDDI